MADTKNLVPSENQGDIVIYQTEDGGTKIDVRFVDETVWLTQQQMAELFQSSRTNIVEHIHHIYEEGELDEISTCRKFRQVRTEGSRQVTREIPYYNLDMDRVLSSTGEQLLVGAGKVSHKQAIEKANREYQRFLVQNLSPVEEAYLQTIKAVEKATKKKAEED